MEEKNAKCPNCGAELYLRHEKGSGFCPNCSKQFDAEKAVKLYKSIHETVEKAEKKVAKGSDYLEVDRILDRAEFYFGKKQFDKAKEELESALKLTNSDYRVYFGLVRAETKNLTDYRNTSHIEYLNKAIDCADSEEKSVITRLYKDFFQLSKCSDEEIEQYKKEENQAKKSKLEQKLKELIPPFMKKERGLKIYPILFSAAYAVCVLLLVLAIVLKIEYLFVVGAFIGVGGYAFTRKFLDDKKSVSLFNAILDYYDELDKLSLSQEELGNILSEMKNCQTVFSGKNGVFVQEEAVLKVIKATLETGNENATQFVNNHSFLKKYAGYYEIDDSESE